MTEGKIKACFEKNLEFFGIAKFEKETKRVLELKNANGKTLMNFLILPNSAVAKILEDKNKLKGFAEKC